VCGFLFKKRRRLDDRDLIQKARQKGSLDIAELKEKKAIKDEKVMKAKKQVLKKEMKSPKKKGGKKAQEQALQTPIKRKRPAEEPAEEIQRRAGYGYATRIKFRHPSEDSVIDFDEDFQGPNLGGEAERANSTSLYSLPDDSENTQFDDEASAVANMRNSRRRRSTTSYALRNLSRESSEGIISDITEGPYEEEPHVDEPHEDDLQEDESCEDQSHEDISREDELREEEPQYPATSNNPEKATLTYILGERVQSLEILDMIGVDSGFQPAARHDSAHSNFGLDKSGSPTGITSKRTDTP